jgi:hypothetical protein
VVEEARASSPLSGVPADDGPATTVPDNVAAAVAAAGAGVAADVAAVVGVAARARTSRAAWLAVFVALCFGLAVGFVVFSTREPPRTVVKYVERDREGGGEGESAPAGDQPAAVGEPGSDEPGARAAAPGGPNAPRGGAAVAANREEVPKEGKGGLQGLSGLQGLAGLPKGPDGPSGSAPPSSGGQPLDAAQVQRTVSRYKGSVQRGCWQPALDTRAKDAPSTARVVVSLKVAPTGNVSSASSSGDPRGYRGLAGCITSRVQRWQFPPSSGATTVNVPFVFAAQ